MVAYTVRRLMQGVVVLFLSTFLTYSLILLMPGGPQDQYNELRQNVRGINPEYLKILEKQYGLDQPYPLSYFLWLFDPNDTVGYVYDYKAP
jgi:peptide/nickel transport system permease protein